MNHFAYFGLIVLLISIGVVSVTLMTDDRFLAGSTSVRMPNIPERIPTPTLMITPNVTPMPVSIPSESAHVYYPMTQYLERITNRGHGDTIVESDREPLPCGDSFSGFHVGDDLEVENSELHMDVPVYAVADGIVRRVDVVNGYGGLVIVEHILGGEVVNVYYGHVDLHKTTVQEGDTVEAGQQITVLGSACSPQTSGERKHLHFSIQKGTSIDVRGYINDRSELAKWYDPKLFLDKLGAQDPL